MSTQYLDTWDYGITTSSSPWKKVYGNSNVNIPGNFLNVTHDDVNRREPLYPEMVDWEASFTIEGVPGKELVFSFTFPGLAWPQPTPYMQWVGDQLTLSGMTVGVTSFGNWNGQQPSGTTFDIQVYAKPSQGTLQIVCAGIDSGTVLVPSVSSWLTPLLLGTLHKGAFRDKEAVKVYPITFTILTEIEKIHKPSPPPAEGDIWMGLTNGEGSIEIVKNDLRRDPGLETAVLISVFTDQRVEEEAVPDNSADRRGWWGDLSEDATGSKFWLLFRSSTTVIPQGTRLVRDDGVEFETTAQGAISGGQDIVEVEALTAGVDGNTDPGIFLTLTSPITGLNETHEVSYGGMGGGVDTESDESLRERILARIQYPPAGGSAQDQERNYQKEGGEKKWQIVKLN